jgi:Protein of unknown function (DUF551).
MNDRIEQIKARLDDATPGEWKRSKFIDSNTYIHWSKEEKAHADREERMTIRGAGFLGTPECNAIMRIARAQNDNDVDLVAHAPADIAYLLSSLAEANAEIAQLKAAHRWIPVEEKLPKDDEFVLVLRGKNLIDIARRKNVYGYAWFINCIPHDDITHWQPLPQPPENYK